MQTSRDAQEVFSFPHYNQNFRSAGKINSSSNLVTIQQFSKRYGMDFQESTVASVLHF